MNGQDYEAVGIDPSAVMEAQKLQTELGDLAVLYVLLQIQAKLPDREPVFNSWQELAGYHRQRARTNGSNTTHEGGKA